ncbi:MBL fold metallo-hydrolase [Candidatus Bipolaricaulota bacterium]
MTNSRIVVENEHFRLEQLAEGIYAAVNTLEGAAMSNAGIIDLGDETLVFDAFLTRAAASTLRQAAEDLTGRAPRYLIHSHGHGDHIWGGSAFLPEATIITSHGAAVMMTAGERSSIEPAELTEVIEGLKRSITNEADEGARLNYESNLYPRQHLLKELPLVLAPPAVVFDGRMDIRGSQRGVQLVVVDRAHTQGDVYLVCPDDGVVFLGDLSFSKDSPPYIAPEGDIIAWSDLLLDLESLDVEQYVPGHGDVAGVEVLAAQRRFQEMAVEVAREVSGSGGTLEDVIDRMSKTEYSRWTKVPLFSASLQSALDRVSREATP